ncbi:hypothetical protein D3870_09715 [Noviherbaspirillum cavernae]|uniref:DUF1834 family protein n=1 Tax=Noviherbaspirillum cavernae TaxID=2320862 RepID=A0A418X1C7_9BURK|nr:hypothetical protein [Noviherbaspirillum cavernae]RJG06250.1 hypothetical protein D3870_09715 [Noviherbaspirillum cavernae]
MNLSLIIAQLRARVPEFGNRVGGAANFKILPEAANFHAPAAYVIPMDESPERNQSGNGYRQRVQEGFGVIVVVSNVADERGQSALLSVHDMRALLFRALLGFRPAEEYDAIEYDGGNLLHMDRARLYFQFEFVVDYEIGEDDTWLAVRDSELPDWQGLDIEVDVAEPDGQIEAKTSINFPPP